MKSKSAKITCWVCLGIAAVCLIAAVVLILSGLDTPEREDSGLFIGGIVLLIIGVGFGVCAPAVAVGSKRQQQQREAVEQFMRQYAGENAVYLMGTYRKTGDKGKAAAKTAASIAGGVLAAAFLGVGVYKIYGADTPMGFIVSDKGLFIFNPAMELTPANVSFVAKGKFGQTEIIVKSRQVEFHDLQTGDIFKLNITDKNVTAEEIGGRLKALVNAQSEPQPSEAATSDGEVS